VRGRGLIYLNPQGRQQTNKHRAIVPLCAVALAEIRTWERTSEYVIDYRGEPLLAQKSLKIAGDLERETRLELAT
jgi:hypothetical protein